MRTFTEELRTERERLLDRLERRQDEERALGTQAAEPRDEADLATAERDVDRLTSLDARDARRAEAIGRFLARAALGRASECERCAGPMEIARLRALPGTTLCVDCAHDVEAERRREEAG